MKRHTLGLTGIEVTELAFGTLTVGKLQSNMTVEESVPAIRRALELGINFFDTAQMYGSEGHLAAGLGDCVNDVVIATKSKTLTVDECRTALAESLDNLRRDYIDIYLMHLIDGPEDMKARLPVLEYLLEQKRNGVIRAIGASVHKVAAAQTVVGQPGIEVLFSILNPEGLGIIDGTGEEMVEVSQRAKRSGMGVYAMKPLGGGHLRGEPAKAFDYVRGLGVADAVCVGMKDVAEVEMNVALFEDRMVTPEMTAGVDATKRLLKIYDNCVGCGKCIPACAQGALSVDSTRTDPEVGKKGQAIVDEELCILCGYCAHECPAFAIRVI